MDSNSSSEQDPFLVVVDDPVLSRGYVFGVTGAAHEWQARAVVVSHLLAIDRFAGVEIWQAVNEDAGEVPVTVRRRWARHCPAVVLATLASFMTLSQVSPSTLTGLSVLAADAHDGGPADV